MKLVRIPTDERTRTKFAERVQACVLAMPDNVRNFNIDNIRVAKIVGNSVGGTTVVKGLCLTRNVIGSITDVKDAKIVVYGIPLDSVKLVVGLGWVG